MSGVTRNSADQFVIVISELILDWRADEVVTRQNGQSKGD